MDARSSNLHNKQHNRDALNFAAKKIEFYKHNLEQEDIDELLGVLDSIFLTTGECVARFEQKLAAYVGSPYAIGLMSCTHALELALRYYNIGPEDEVITTPLSFVATANVIEVVGAKPVFVDVEAHTGNINVQLVEAAITKKTRAIIPVHLYGQMCDMRALRHIADRYGLKIIEDAAHCLEGVRDGVKPGELGDGACFSFYATKNITSGEGGAITVHDAQFYEWLRSARSHGISSDAADRYTKLYKHYDMQFVGQKCNMSNIQAALLVHQIDRVDQVHQQREKLFEFYEAELSDFARPALLANSRHALHLYTLWVDAAQRDAYLHTLQGLGIGVAVNYRPIHLMAYYKNKYGYKNGDFPVAEYIGASTISIPFYPKLSPEDASYVVSCLRRGVCL